VSLAVCKNVDNIAQKFVELVVEQAFVHVQVQDSLELSFF
jgi:hypothetical protein